MKKFIGILFFLLFSVCFAQSNRFIYDYSVRQNGEYQKMYMVLDVNPKDSRFYDYKFIEMDSLTKATPGNVFKTNSQAEQVLVRPSNTFSNTSYFTNNKGDYFSIQTTDIILWKIEKEKKNIDNYKLQRATTVFGGRKWTAWFAKDVPVYEGPYKFRGLPGLIFEIEDESGDFKYKLIKNKHLKETFDYSNFVDTYYGIKPISITQKQFFKLKLDDYNDPVANLANILKGGGTVNMNGENITSVTQLDQKRKFQQQNILKYYNPIEKDKAIPYPKK